MRTTDGRWVRNGDTWHITAVHPDGALAVCDWRSVSDARKPHVLLDPHYVAEHVQLSYAITVHRAQGATVDRCHVVVSPGMTREAFYVAMTRGRDANSAYVVTEHTNPEMEGHLQPTREPLSTKQVLHDVLATEGTERSATEQLQQALIDRASVRARRPTLPIPNESRFMHAVATTGIGIDR